MQEQESNTKMSRMIAVIGSSDTWLQAADKLGMSVPALRQWAVDNHMPDYMIGKLDKSLTMKEVEALTAPEPAAEPTVDDIMDVVEQAKQFAEEVIAEQEALPEMRPIKIVTDGPEKVQSVYTIDRVRAVQRRKNLNDASVQRMVDRLNVWYTAGGDLRKVRLICSDEKSANDVQQTAYYYRQIVPQEMWGAGWGKRPRGMGRDDRVRVLEDRIHLLESQAIRRGSEFSIVRRVWPRVPVTKVFVPFRWLGRQVARRVRAIVRAVVKGE